MLPTDEVGARRDGAFIGSNLRSLLGPQLLRLLDDANVLDIHLNDDGRVWVRHRRLGNLPTDHHVDANSALALLSFLAGAERKELTPQNPTLGGVLPIGGVRFQGAIPPVVSSPVFSLRKPAATVYSLDSYVSSGRLSAPQVSYLRQAIRAAPSRPPLNTLVVGGTGSGKTTLANALLRELASETDRILILEDTPEIRCDSPNRVSFLTNPHSATGLRELLRATLRHDPDRIVVGEVRGAEALDLLKAWSTGHPGGIATLHATDPLGALERLDNLAQEAGVGSQRWLIAHTVELIVHLPSKASTVQPATLTRLGGLTPQSHYALVPVNVDGAELPTTP